MSGSADCFGGGGSRPSAFGLGRHPKIPTLIVKKTNPKPLPEVPAGRGRSLFRRMGTLGTQAHGRRGLGAAQAPAAQEGHLPPAQGDRTVSGLLRCPRRLPERYLSPAETAPGPLPGFPAAARLLPDQAAVCHLGQSAQRPRSPASPRLAPQAQDPAMPAATL